MLAGAPLGVAHAAAVYWTNSAGGNYSDADNWKDGSGPPTSADSANFTNANVAYTVTVDADRTNQSLTASGKSATVVLDATGKRLWYTGGVTVQNATESTLVLAGGDLYATNALTTVVLGNSTSTRGTLILSNGTLNSVQQTVGAGNSTIGMLNIFGGTNAISSYLRIGVNGLANGSVLLDGNQAVLSVGGSGVSVGYNGTGKLTVSNGVLSGSSLTVGANSGSVGQLDVYSGSNVFSSTFQVGSVGANSSATLANGSFLETGAGTIGSGSTSNNSILVTGSGTVWKSTGLLTVGGNFGFNNTLSVFAGGKVLSTGTSKIGAGSNLNTVVIAGDGSLWYNNGALYFGGDAYAGSCNQLWITNNGTMSSGGSGITLGQKAGGQSNAVIVASGGSWTNGSVIVGGSANSVYNYVTVTNGGKVVSSSILTLGSSAGANSNSVLVTGSNSIWTSGGNLTVGSSGLGNRLEISDGGCVVDQQGTLGNSAGANSNSVLVTGSGTVWSNTSALLVGNSSAGNTLTVANSGLVSATAVFIGVSNTATANALIVTNGAVVRITGGGGMSVGSNTTTKGSGSVFLGDGATLEAQSLNSGYDGSGVISNVGGVYQFTINAPTITANTANSILLSNGWVAFRGVNAAAIDGQITNLAYSGANTLRLDSSTNAALSYAFTNGGSLQALELVGVNPRWQGPSLLIGAGGELRISNATAGVNAALTNAGTIRAVNAHVTYSSPVVLGGGYVSDPSTNTFLSNLTVTSSGYLQGGVGDRFVFQQNLILQSTNTTQFDLSTAAIQFSSGGATNHVLDLTGGGAADLGSNWTSVAQLATNFAVGRLTLSLGNSLQITGGVANAFYIGVLDLGGLDVGNLENALDLDVNLYYDPLAVGNEYLGGLVYDYAEWNGALIPLSIPEPSAFLALGAGLTLLAFLRHRKRREERGKTGD